MLASYALHLSYSGLAGCLFAGLILRFQPSGSVLLLVNIRNKKEKKPPPSIRNLWMYNGIGRDDIRRAVQAGLAAAIFNLRFFDCASRAP